MFARTLLAGLSFAAIFSQAAMAQCGSPRYQPRVQYAKQIIPIIDTPAATYQASVPTLDELARAATNHVESRFQSCESHRIQNQKWAMQQEAARKNSVRSATQKQWTDEELAASKYQAAHGLWRAGNTDAARRWLEIVLRDYATTRTADRARGVLAKL
jgi:hypothetical protein